MTTYEALETIIQQNRKLNGLIDNAIEIGGEKHEELEQAIKDNLNSINTINNTLNTFWNGCKGEIEANNLGRIKLALGNIGTGVGHTATKVVQDLQALGTNYCSLYNLAHFIKSFIESTDTKDETINTWREIEEFLEGIKDSDSLLTIINNLSSEITKVENNLTEDINLLRTDVQTELDERKIKDVDNLGIIKDENGIIKINYPLNSSGCTNREHDETLNSNIIYTNTIYDKFGIRTHVTVSTYSGTKAPDVNNVNLVQEKGLYRQLQPINENITDMQGQLLVLTTNAKITIAVSPTTIYKGTDTSIKATATFTSTDADLIPESIQVTGSTANDTQQNVKTVAITEILNTTSNAVRYETTCIVKGVKLTSSVNINARYPIYYGFGNNATEVITSGTKLGATTTASRTYTSTNNKGKDCNFFMLVPTDITAPTKFSMGGAPASFNTTSETLNGIAYKVIKSGGIYANGAKVEITAS